MDISDGWRKAQTPEEAARAIPQDLASRQSTGCPETGVEKKNDDIRRFFHRKINRWDASTSVLLVKKRQEDLGGYERQPRKYMKKNEAFWCNGGKQQIARDYPRISTQTTQPRED